eukprot:TRINITY_DN6335_c0_g3_i1.p1 TRINITY_DN6335_c0_g3~~TRINITY_DN6335_c0_g3_i1.p1  ORF type:complete len:1192 (+),score=533.90 TRINITY_DN6335_c0_g3_i1:46-3621(+)
MAYLSTATDGWVTTTHARNNHHMTKKEKKQIVDVNNNEDGAKKLGIKLQGQFDSKIRCLEMFDASRPLNDLRVWTAEQDGSLTIRKATTGQPTCCMDRKKDVFVSALLYHDQCMYAGLTDGYIRVYREIPETTKVVDYSKEGAKLGATFKKGTLIINEVKIGSVGDRGGLAPDMMIVSIDGVEVQSSADVKQALANAKEKKPAKLKIGVRQVNSAGEPDYFYDEVRKHTGAVTCLEVVTGMGGDYKIFSGGNDWQIYVWAWDAEKTVFLSNMTFPGHQNAVRCLHFHPKDELTGTGGYLYSGGDDCYIRCLDIAGGEEIATRNGFPIETLGCVRALAAYRNNLFSVTNEALVQVWDATAGTLTATLFPFPKTRHFSSATHAQLCLHVVNNKLWTGGADGVIRVWRANGPLPNEREWLETELYHHRGHFVNKITSAQGAADGHIAWCTTEDGRIKLMYTESDAAEPESERIGEGFTATERGLVQTIDDKRKQMIANSEELSRRTKLHERIKNNDAKRKQMIVDIYNEQAELLTKRRYFFKLMGWYARQKDVGLKTIIADTLSSYGRKQFLRRYYGKLLDNAHRQADARRHQRVVEYLMGTTNEGLQIMYYRKLKKYAAAVLKKRQTEHIAKMLLGGTHNALRATYHSKALLWLRSKQREKCNQEVVAILAKSRTALLAQYYFKLIAYNKKEQDLKRKIEAMGALRESHDNAIRQYYIAKVTKHMRRKAETQRQDTLAKTLEANRENYLRLKYGRRCKQFLRKAVVERELKKQEQLDEDIRKLEELLAKSRVMQAEAIDRETAAEDKAIAELEKECASIEEEVKLVTKENRDLTNKLYAPNMKFKEEKTPEETMGVIVNFLKAKSVYCYDDMYAIKSNHTTHTAFLKTKRDVAGKFDPQSKISPAKLFDSGVKLIRVGCEEQLRRQGEADYSWITPAQVIAQKDDLFQDTSAFGLKQMIVAWDQFMMLDPAVRKDARPETLKEAIDLQDILVTTAGRIHEEREKKRDEHALSPPGTPFPIHPARKGGVRPPLRSGSSRSLGSLRSGSNRSLRTTSAQSLNGTPRSDPKTPPQEPIPIQSTGSFLDETADEAVRGGRAAPLTKSVSPALGRSPARTVPKKSPAGAPSTSPARSAKATVSPATSARKVPSTTPPASGRVPTSARKSGVPAGAKVPRRNPSKQRGSVPKPQNMAEF